MKLVYIYVGVVFGGAAIALAVYRYQDRGWSGLTLFVAVGAGVYAASRRAQRKAAKEQPSGREDD